MKEILSLAILFCTLIYATSFAQITVPEETQRDTPIVATIAIDMPEGAEFDGQWVLDEGATFLPVKDGVIHIWAAPGDHKVVFNGVWIDFENRKFKFVNLNAPYKVLGGVDPDPTPDPTPGPVGPKQMMFFVISNDLDQLPLGQRVILTSLNVRKNLEDKGHKFLLVVDDGQINEGVPSEYLAWIKAAKDKDLPLIAIAPKEGGKIVTYPMPKDYKELLELLEQ